MTTPIPVTDVLRPFQLERSALRGRALRLDATIDRVLAAHAYPEPVSALLGELLVLAGGFAGALKFNGTFSLQVRGEGAVGLMVADVDNQGGMRGYASFDADAVGEDHACGLEALVGVGLLAVTVDQTRSGGRVYQGIVELGERSLENCMVTYFRQSEQVPTGIRSAVRRDEAGWRAGAVIVQAMPGQATPMKEDAPSDDWIRAMMLLQTVSDDELTSSSLPLDDLLFRLFHEDGVRVFEPLPLSFSCSCNQERIIAVLREFPRNDVEDMRSSDGSIAVTCEFCSRAHRLDRETVNEIVGGNGRP